jgi:apolipoprotein D and lipocalin family protein
VDVLKYTGKWFEVARLPNRFQRKCVTSTAEYAYMPKTNSVSVFNTCYKKKGTTTISGVASIVDKSTNAKLSISFDKWYFKVFFFIPKGKYWILDLKTNDQGQYTDALVGTPDRKFLWILSRKNSLSQQLLTEYKEKAAKLGFSADKLIISGELF